MRGRNWSPPKATTTLGTSGPVRVVSDQPDESIEIRPAGFTGITTALILGRVQPPARVRVWFGKRSGWWRWTCPACPHQLGGFCVDQPTAYAAARRHADEHAKETA